MSVFTHGVNFFVMLLDGWLSRQPYLISHGLYFLAYCVIYLIWSVIHAVANIKNADDEEYIYAALDWRQTMSKAAMYAVAVVIIAAPLVNLFFWWLLHYQRRHLNYPQDEAGRYFNRGEEDNSAGRSEVDLTQLTSSHTSGQPRELRVDTSQVVMLSSAPHPLPVTPCAGVVGTLASQQRLVQGGSPMQYPPQLVPAPIHHV